MRKWLPKIVLMGVVLVYASCNNKTYSAQEYIAWVESEAYPLTYTKEINGYKIALKYLPQEYMYLKSTDSVDMEKLKPNNKISVKNTAVCMLLRITHQSKMDILKLNTKSKEDYSRLVNYFSFDIAHDMELSNTKESATCSFVHFERNYGLSPHSNLLLEFDKVGVNDKGLLFTYNDRALNLGRINIQIPASDLKSLEMYHVE